MLRAAIVGCGPRGNEHMRPWKSGVPDRRELGLPIFSIAFTRTAEAVSDGDQRPSSTFRQMRFDSLFSKGRRG